MLQRIRASSILVVEYVTRYRNEIEFSTNDLVIARIVYFRLICSLLVTEKNIPMWRSLNSKGH